MGSNDRRLIEVSLPLKAISAQSAREKSIRHGHISTLRIWWARRPLAAMRAAIFASLIPAPDSDAERERLEDLIATIVDWDQVKDGNSAKIRKSQDFIRQAFTKCPPDRTGHVGLPAEMSKLAARSACTCGWRPAAKSMPTW
jgi:putative DNA methylase